MVCLTVDVSTGVRAGLSLQILHASTLTLPHATQWLSQLLRLLLSQLRL